MNRLNNYERAKILALLCEGMGINATCRVSGASKMTVLKLLADVGQACADYMDDNIRGLVIPPKRAASKSRINTSPAFSAGRVSLLKPSYAFALE